MEQSSRKSRSGEAGGRLEVARKGSSESTALLMPHLRLPASRTVRGSACAGVRPVDGSVAAALGD